MTAADEPKMDFGGSIPDAYDRLLVPMLFAPYAADIAARLGELTTGALLEVAAGTGAVTRELAARLPVGVEITATDLNPAMLARAEGIGTARPVVWQQADVMALPFDDATFDAAVCQFGVMFFPDRPAAFAEIRRVLRPGGTLVFSVWNGLDENDFVRTLSETAPLADNTGQFFGSIPYGYHDLEQIRADLLAGGFTDPARFDTVESCSRAASPKVAAEAYCEGTPMRHAILSRDPSGMDAAIARVAAALATQYGDTDIEGRTSAKVVTAIAP